MEAFEEATEVSGAVEVVAEETDHLKAVEVVGAVTTVDLCPVAEGEEAIVEEEGASMLKEGVAEVSKLGATRNKKLRKNFWNVWL